MSKLKRLPTWTAVFATIAALFFSAAFAADPAKTADVVIFARIAALIDATHVSMNRGATDGVRLGQDDPTLHPFRIRDGETEPRVDSGTRLARAKVIKLEANSATLELRSVAEAALVGDLIQYTTQVSLFWEGEPLFLVVARCGEMVDTNGNPLLTLGELLANPTTSQRDAVVDRLVKSLISGRELALKAQTMLEKAGVKTLPLGRYKGLRFDEAIAATKADDVQDFIAYLDERIVCIEPKFTLLSKYAGWLIDGAPTVNKITALAAKFEAPAKQAARDGRFGDAEEAWRNALKLLPNSADYKEALRKLDQMRVWQAKLVRDTDDTATRMSLMNTLYDHGAYDLALAEIVKLEKVGYQEERCAAYRGFIFHKRKKFAESGQVFRKILEKRRDAPYANWLRFVEAMAQLEKTPSAFAAHLTLAQVNEDDEEFDDARDRWQQAIDFATTPAQSKQAIDGQHRVALLRKLKAAEEAAKNFLNDQKATSAKGALARLRHLCAESADPKCVVDRLGRLAAIARSAQLHDLGQELFAERVRAAPDRADVLRELAWQTYAAGDADAAEPLIAKALTLDPASDYGHLVAAWVASAQGHSRAARREATIAARDPNYGWARQMMTQVCLIDGEYADAVKWADEGLVLQPDEAQLGAAHAAAYVSFEAAAEIARGKDILRNQLRLVRALVWVDAAQAAMNWAEKIPTSSPFYREAMWSIASIGSTATPTQLKLTAARAAAPTTPSRLRRLQMLEMEMKFRAQPQDLQVRMAYARASVAVGEFKQALVVIGDDGGLYGNDISQAVEIESQARRGVRADGISTAATDASNRSDYPSMIAAGNQAYAIYAALHLPHEGGRAISQAAAGHASLGRYKEGMDLLREPLAQLVADGDEDVLYALRKQQQSYAYMLGDLAGFGRAVAEASQVAADRDDLWDQTNTLLQRVSEESNEGKTKLAISHVRQARKMAELLGNRSLGRAVTRALADNLNDAGILPEARREADGLLLASRAALDSYNERFSLLLLGIVAMRQGNSATAHARFDDVYAVGVRSGDTQVRAQARVFAGDLALDVERDPKAAVTLLQQAATLYQSQEDENGELHACLSLTRAHLRQNELGAARKSVDRAVALARRPAQLFSLPIALTTAADVLVREGKPAEAVPLAREASQIAESRDLTTHIMQAQHTLGMALQANHADAEAANALDRAAVLATEVVSRGGEEEDRQGQLAVGDIRDMFRDAIDILIRLGKVERALELLEMSRDANLRKIFDPTRLKPQDSKVAGTLEDMKSTAAQNAAAKKALSEELAKPKEQQSSERVKALSERVAGTDGELRQLLSRLKRDNRQLYALLAITPESIAELRDSLPADAMVLEYFTAADALYAFVISRDKQNVRAYKVPVSAKEVEATVVAFRKALEQGDRVRGKAAAKTKRGSQAFGGDDTATPAQTVELGRKLYDWLLAPVAAELAQAKTTMIVPFGPLYYLPFHALVLPAPKDKPDAPPTYAIEKYRLAYLSSTTIFKMLRRQKLVAPWTLLAFANPDGSLPGARAEMERVRGASFPQANVLFEQAATKGKFFELASHYRIIHFATHGILDRDPLASYLKMAKEPLTVDEITGFSGLEEKTDLVVLSACETAIEAGHSNGDEVISIASAFATAGAPALVASLWAVDDAATSELMAEFYRLLQANPPVDTLEALRQAQMHVLRFEKDGKRVFAAPGYWAAFELIGDYR